MHDDKGMQDSWLHAGCTVLCSFFTNDPNQEGAILCLSYAATVTKITIYRIPHNSKLFKTVLTVKGNKEDIKLHLRNSVHWPRQSELPVVRPLLLGPLQGLVHGLLILTPTLGAVPLALGLMMEPNTGEMKPLNGTFIVVAANHFSVGHLLTQAVCWLIWINGQVWG